MDRQFFYLLLLTLPFFGLGQVGVGTNNVHPSAKFQIESNNKGFLQPRIALTGTTDVTTIAIPATGLMVFNTATAGSGITAITPGVHYFDGAKWVRLADATEATGITGGSTAGIYVAGQFLIPNPYNRVITTTSNPFSAKAMKLGAISLPPGKWEVLVENLCEVYKWRYLSGNVTAVKMMYWLQNDSITQTMDLGNATVSGAGSAANNWRAYPPLGGGDTLFRNSANFVQPIQASNPHHKGSFFINNESGSDKTYYLFAFEHTNVMTINPPDYFMPEYGYWGDFANQASVFNRFYEKKIE